MSKIVDLTNEEQLSDALIRTGINSVYGLKNASDSILEAYFSERRKHMGQTRFKYEGPVKSFGEIINSKWEGETWAVNEAKALSNLSYQYKKKKGLLTSTKIELDPNKLKEVSTYEDERDR